MGISSHHCKRIWVVATHTSMHMPYIPGVPEEISDKIYRALEESCASCKSNLIALSGGLDSTIIAYMSRKRKPRGVAVIAEEFISTDLTYCQMVAGRMGIPMSIHAAGMTEMLDAVEETIRILENFNDIEIRNNIVMYMALKWARDNGEKSIITGDGADELFAGYRFLINKPQDELEGEIRRVCAVMHFPTQKIGKALGVEVESPFLSSQMQEIAQKMPVDLKVRSEGKERHGKWILRKMFERQIPPRIAWRLKSPMQDGAGTSGLTGLFESVIDQDEFAKRKKTIQAEDGITIRNSESMYYYDVFRRHFGPPEQVKDDPCPYCRCATRGSKFCRMCGAFPV